MIDKTFEFCAVGLAHVSPQGNFIKVNQKLCDFLGYERHVLKHMTFQELTVAEYLNTDLTNLEQLLAGKIDSYAMEKQYLRKDGVAVWGKLTVSLVRDANDNPDFFISVVEDIDEKKRLESELFQVEALFSKIVNEFSSRTFIWVSSPDFKKMHYLNDGYHSIFGRSEYELYAKPLAFIDHVHEDDKPKVRAVFDQRPLKSWELQYRIYDISGQVRYLHDRGSLIYDAKEQQTLILGAADDITKEKEQQRALEQAVNELAFLSKTDPLTGLINRREIFEQLSKEIERMKRERHVSTLVYIDLNEFKQINDNYGHKVGDNALIVFSEKMQAILRDSDRMGRIGGDEFVILLYGTKAAEVERFFARIDELAFVILAEDNISIPIRYTLGWKEWSDELSSVQEWLDAADHAMYTIKKKPNGNEVVRINKQS
jgi:diguanylate cyclase (GGDEF)-like protein/PAS domain S-box-containing protein